MSRKAGRLTHYPVILREQSEPKDLPAGLQLREQRSFDDAQDDKYCAQDDKYCAKDDK